MWRRPDGMNQVTIATNMAGRGTDILLGGNAEFMARQEMVKKGIAQQLRTAGGEVALEPGYVREHCLLLQRAVNTSARRTNGTRPSTNTKKKLMRSTKNGFELGGLHILGTERHEARRIDNQLRGRAGRQGDPGSSRFYLSLEDDLMRIFAKDWVSTLLQTPGHGRRRAD